jgi:hypothetical protein
MKIINKVELDHDDSITDVDVCDHFIYVLYSGKRFDIYNTETNQYHTQFEF